MLKYVFSFFKKSKKKLPKIEINMTQFKEDLHDKLAKVETKSFIYDYQSAISQLYMMDTINFKKAMEDNENKKDESQEILEKAKIEELKINSTFFNDFSLKILQNTDNSNLIDTACKSFVGSTGIKLLI
jgi:hypothetical protein